MKKKRIVSGMRPTGKLHLGHVHGEVDDVADFPELIVEIRSEINDEFCACKLANC